MYTGRSQYPKFKYKPLFRSNLTQNKYACPHMLYWGEVKTVLGFLSQHLPVHNSTKTRQLVESFGGLLQFAELHKDALSDELLTKSSHKLA